MLKTKVISQKSISPIFENLAREAVTNAIAKQRALGLPNYFSRNGKIYGRNPQGQFVSVK
jgi:hypothetical protein